MEEFAKLVGQDQTYCWRPFTQMEGSPLPLPVVGAREAEIYLGDGRVVIDAISSWWVNLHGHGHPYLIEKMQEQIARLDQVVFADFTHEGAAQLAERLVHLLPATIHRIFYSDNGSTAVETALKMALQYWHNRGERRHRLVALSGGYHGETFGAMALSSRNLFSRPFASHLFEVTFVDPSEEGLVQLEGLLLREDVAAFFFEPSLQGVGGMATYPVAILDEMIHSCRSAGTLTVADEVLTGCGRTGPYFASSRLKNPPDMICLAKGLTSGTVPLGVTACSEEVYEGFLSSDRSKALLHGHSYCANPLACAAALASLDLLVSERCDAQRRRIEEAHRSVAVRWSQHEEVKRVEVIGTVLAVELREETTYFHAMRDSLARHFLSRGVFIRPFGNVVHLIPPYCITAAQLNQVYAAVEESFALVAV